MTKAQRHVDKNSRTASSDIIDPTEAVHRQAKGQDEIASAVAATDPLDAAALEALVEKLDEHDGALAPKVTAFQSLWPRIAYGDRDKHIEAIALTRNLNLFEKNALLQATKDAWQARLTKRACRRGQSR